MFVNRLLKNPLQGKMVLVKLLYTPQNNVQYQHVILFIHVLNHLLNYWNYCVLMALHFRQYVNIHINQQVTIYVNLSLSL